MAEKRTFLRQLKDLVPEEAREFDDFSDYTVSMNDLFKVLGLEGFKDAREKLHSPLRLFLKASIEEFGLKNLLDMEYQDSILDHDTDLSEPVCRLVWLNALKALKRLPTAPEIQEYVKDDPTFKTRVVRARNHLVKQHKMLRDNRWADLKAWRTKVAQENEAKLQGEDIHDVPSLMHMVAATASRNSNIHSKKFSVNRLNEIKAGRKGPVLPYATWLTRITPLKVLRALYDKEAYFDGLKPDVLMALPYELLLWLESFQIGYSKDIILADVIKTLRTTQYFSDLASSSEVSKNSIFRIDTSLKVNRTRKLTVQHMGRIIKRLRVQGAREKHRNFTYNLKTQKSPDFGGTFQGHNKLLMDLLNNHFTGVYKAFHYLTVRRALLTDVGIGGFAQYQNVTAMFAPAITIKQYLQQRLGVPRAEKALYAKTKQYSDKKKGGGGFYLSAQALALREVLTATLIYIDCYGEKTHDSLMQLLTIRMKDTEFDIREGNMVP